jgi:hypothetical protein
MQRGYLKKDAAKKEMKGGGAEGSFNTETYLMNPDMIQGKSKPKKSTLLDVNNKPRSTIRLEDGIISMGYRLPTEAEWENACRAGSKTAYSFDDEEGLLPEYGWFRSNSSGRTHTVGLLEPNAWGLYDMHGNVWEWCSDRHGKYPRGAVSDPTGPKDGTDRVIRGGYWNADAAGCRSAYRYGSIPSYRYDGRGLRVALSPSGIPK